MIWDIKYHYREKAMKQTIDVDEIVEAPKSLTEHIKLIPDQRIQLKCRHRLVDINNIDLFNYLWSG